jgi:poly(3-hydroxybutyrate) depolymerase
MFSIRRTVAALAASSLVLIGAIGGAAAANAVTPVWAYHQISTKGAKQLWILLHGDNVNGNQFCIDTNAAVFAAANKANVVCVTSPGNTYTGSADDLQWVRRITINVQAATKISRAHTYLVGFGSGADLAYESACLEAPLYGGFAAFAGQWPVKDATSGAPASWIKKCYPTAHRPVLSVHGTGDSVLTDAAANLKGWQTFTTKALGLKSKAKSRASGFSGVTCQAVATKNASVYCTWAGGRVFPIQANAAGTSTPIATFDGLSLAAKFITHG